MSEDLPSPQRPLTHSQSERIDDLCDAYESAWQSGKRPRIEDFLKGLEEAESQRTLTELLLSTWHLIQSEGQTPEAQPFLEQFPQFTETVKQAWRTYSSQSLPDATLPSLPSEIGHFRLLERVGVGAFGEVWKAHDTELDRLVAIKRPKQHLLDENEIDRFLSEARTAAQLRHAGIVTVHEIRRDHASLFIVSDFIDGPALSDRIKEDRPSLTETVQIARSIATALHHAHEAGVIHRDLKPQNILLDAEGAPHITDFGLARWEQSGIRVSREGTLLGTPAYMSPEQARGEATQADRRTDVYSLGVVLYELLTGTIPFDGEMHAVLQQIQHEDVPSLRNKLPRIPRDLDTICRKCLEKEPGKRYASAAALAEDLRRFQEGEAIVARPISTAEMIWRRATKHPLQTALASVLLVTIIVAISYIQSLPTSPEARDSLAVLIRAAGEDSEIISKDLTRRLCRELNHISSLSVLPPGDTLALAGENLPGAALARELGVRAALSGELRSTPDQIDLVLTLSGDDLDKPLWSKSFRGSPKEIPAFEAGATESIVRSLEVPLTGDEELKLTSRALVNPDAYQPYFEARLLQRQGTPNALMIAITLLEKAVRLDPSFVDAYSALASANTELAYFWFRPHGYHAKAQEWAQKALELDDNALEAQATMGTVAYYGDHNWGKAIETLEGILTTDAGLTEKSTCFLHAYDSIGRFDLSLKAVERAIDKNPTSSSLIIEKGCALYYAGDYQGAIASYKNSLLVETNSVVTYWGLGRSYEQLGDHEAALEWLKKGQETPDGSWQGLLSELGYTYARSGDLEQSQAILDTLLSDQPSELYLDPYILAIIYMGLLERSPDKQELRNKIFNHLEQARKDRSGWITSVMVDPKFFPLHTDPRFRELLIRLKVPPETIDRLLSRHARKSDESLN